MSIEVINFLDRIVPLSPELKERLSSTLKAKTFKKKSFLLKEGEVCNQVYFIEQGLVRVYYMREDKEMCSGILFEGGVVISVNSFFERQKSYEYIQAIEDTVVHYQTYEELEALYRDFAEYNIIGRKLITEYYVRSEERNFVLRRQTASEKYAWFQERFGDVIGRIPRGDIASYLGLNLETLSRLYG